MINFQRKILGILCVLMAPLTILFGLFGDNLPYWYKSISATYYANCNSVIVGLLACTALFFLSYRGYGKLDRIFSDFQALFAVGIVIFPCKTYGIDGTVGLFGVPVNVSHVIHCACATLLFVSFYIMVKFIFTKGDTNNPKKVLRNKYYDVLSTIIIVAIFCEIWYSTVLVNILPVWVPVTMINEAAMLISFGVAWLIKSGYFKRLND